LDGTVKFFGTPAEEAVGGKIYMLRDGVMNGVDVMLAWHPGDRTGADTESTQALVDIRIDFQGRAAHAAFDPWNGRSAADGAELFTHAVNMMREHIRPGARMHYVITTAGDVPNVVPEKATVWMWIRDTERSGVEEMLGRVRKIAQGAALAADVESSLSLNGGDWNMLVNLPGQRVLQSNLEWLGPLSFTNEEQEFAKQIQRAANVAPKGLRTQLEPFENKVKPPTGGSTDVADISWNIPTINLTVTTAPEEAPWHGWPVVACGGMSIGHKGMLYAAKALAATMIDLYRDPNAVAAMQREFAELTRGVDYQPYIPDGPPHLPPGR
jgi:aminobenzoyl-glutamate utilization protein B